MEKIHFLGYVESESSFMMGQKYLGVGVCNDIPERWICGMITGNLNDMWDGNVMPNYYGSPEEFLTNISYEKDPIFKIHYCSYSDACKVVLKLYINKGDNIKTKIGSQILEFDIKKIKEALLYSATN